MGTALSSYEWSSFIEDEEVFDTVVRVKEYKKDYYVIILHDETQMFDRTFWDSILKIWLTPIPTEGA